MNKLTDKPNNDKLAFTIKQELNIQAEQLDSDITTKLDVIRREALATTTHENTVNLNTLGWKIVFAPALAAAFVLAVFINFGNNSSESVDSNFLTSNQLQTDFDVVVKNEDFELMEEELAFYVWLGDESGTG